MHSLSREPSAAFRWIRSGAAAAWAVVLGLSAHMIAGQSPSGSTLAVGLVAFVLLSSLGAITNRRPASVMGLSAAVCAGQLVVHAMLVLFGGHQAHSGASPWQLNMLAAHAGAAVLVGYWLAVGEGHATRVVNLLAYRALHVWQSPIPESVRSGSAFRGWLSTTSDHEPLSLVETRPLVRRGPPGAMSAA